jgi:hypothetical protein
MKFSYMGKNWELKPADINSPDIFQLAGIYHLALKTKKEFSYFIDKNLAVGISETLTIVSTSVFDLELIGGEIEGVKSHPVTSKQHKVPWRIAKDYYEAGLKAQQKREQEIILSRRGMELPPDSTGRFKDLAALCEMFEVPTVEFTIWGSCPVAIVDIHPSWEQGTLGKHGHILLFTNRFQSDFDPTFLGIPNKKRFCLDEYDIEI